MNSGSLAFLLLASTAFAGSTGGRLGGPSGDERHSPPDLKLSGDLLDPQKSQGEMVSYAKLRKLPQEEFTVSDDSNFSHAVKLTGVDLDVLLQAFAAKGSKILIAADCDDGYEAHYTSEYRAAHRPFLVLTINGQAPTELPRTSDGGTYGPYLISHKSFVPSFRVLAHEDEAQIPNGVTGLRFLPEEEVLRALQPPGGTVQNTETKDGSMIALQNCLRCHNQGRFGGRKAGATWQKLGAYARRDPQSFADYIRDPQSQDPSATMPSNAEYDAQTLRALTAYFQAFAPAGKP